MFVGTNAYYLLLRDKVTDEDVDHFFQVSGHTKLKPHSSTIPPGDAFYYMSFLKVTKT